MIAVNVAAIAINIVGVKQCFKEGTLVACLNENGEEVRKPIKNIALGTLVLAYDEETGERAYKKVVRLFRNETKRWCTVTVEVDGQKSKLCLRPGISTICRIIPETEKSACNKNTIVISRFLKNGYLHAN